MSTPFEELAQLDKVTHEPARLAILTALVAYGQADFVTLLRLTGLTRGNLSSHLARLEEAGLITLTKQFVDRKPNTLAALTPSGQEAITWHWQQLERLGQQVRNWPS